MIQRIQSLFLAGVVVLGILLFYLPLYSYPVEAGDLHRYFLGESTFLTVLNILVTVMAAIIIFLYKNRKNQVKLCSLNMLLLTVLIVSNFYFADKPGAATGSAHYEAGSYLLLCNLVLLWLAVRYISKDEKLVRSADRLR